MNFVFKGLNRINQLIFVMVKCGVLFEVRTEFLNVIYTSFVFRGLTKHTQEPGKIGCCGHSPFPPRSRDLTHVDFSFWRFVKYNV
jgi:hypothetical protein